MRSLAAEWRAAGSRGRGFWEDSDGITRAGEARLENHKEVEEKQQVATVSVNLMRALAMSLVEGRV